MICAVYRSKKRSNTYLFVEKKDDFSVVPDALLEIFGKPQFSLLMREEDLEKVKIADPQKLRAELKEKHYYLAVQPEDENLLKQHLATHPLRKKDD